MFDSYAGGCAAHGVILLTGHTRRLTIPAAKQRGGRVVAGTGMYGFLGCCVGSTEVDPYGSCARFPRVRHVCVPGYHRVNHTCQDAVGADRGPLDAAPG